MEILDLIAKVSWETNEKALKGLSQELSNQDKHLEELKLKGARLNDQMSKTNDPKKVKTLNDELGKTKKAVDNITEAHKKQATTVDTLRKKQSDLLKEITKTNDPKTVEGLLKNLKNVEKQMDSLAAKSKGGGLGTSLLEGFGLGAGVFTFTAAIEGIKSFVGDSISEFEDAEKTALNLQRALHVIGKDKYFEGLKTEADQLAEQFHGLFDNDDIIKAQTALVQYGKLSRDEISKVTPVILELATKMDGDLVGASEKVVNILEGRGGQTLRDYGISVKGIKTEHDRLNVVLGEFATKLAGSADVWAKTAEGMEAINKTSLKNIEENLGSTFERIKIKILPIITGALQALNYALETPAEKENRQETLVKNKYAGLIKNFTKDQIEIEKQSLRDKERELDKLRIEIDHKQNDLLKAMNDDRSAALQASLEKDIEKSKKYLEQQTTILKGKHLALLGLAPNDKGALNPNAKDADPEAEAKAAEEAKRRAEEAKKYAIDQAKVINDAKLALMDAQDREEKLLFQKNEEDKKKLKGASDHDKLVVEQAYQKELKMIRDKYAKAYYDGLYDQDLKAKNEKEQAYKDSEAKEKTHQQHIADLIKKGGAELVQGAKDEKAEKKKLDDAEAAAEKELIANANSLETQISSIYTTEINHINELISAQEKRVEVAKTSSNASLKIEQNRLDELVRKRDRYEKQQRTIDAATIVANQAVAISGAVKTIASGGNPVLIAANVLAILAGIAASVSAIRSINQGGQGFRDGGYTGDGDPTDVSNSLGNRGYKYHKKEFVMNESLTSKHRDMLEGMHTGKLIAKKMGGTYVLMPRTLDVDSAIADHNTVKTNLNTASMEGLLKSIDDKLSGREVNVHFNADADGFSTRIASQLGRLSIINQMRNS